MRRCAAITDHLYEQNDRPFELKPVPIIIGAVLLAIAVWGSYHYRHVIEHSVIIVQSFGVYGIAFAIFLMALLCIIPVPSEFLILLNMEVYGVGWGLFYSWIGAVIGAVAAMYLTRWRFQSLLRRLFSLHRQQQVDEWVKRRGTMGLLGLRFVPFVPFHALNYVAGVLNVSFWPFVWTTAVGIIPFDLLMGGAFLGITHGVVPALISGSLCLIVFAGISYVFRKKWLAAFSGQPAAADKPASAGRNL